MLINRVVPNPQRLEFSKENGQSTNSPHKTFMEMWCHRLWDPLVTYFLHEEQVEFHPSRLLFGIPGCLLLEAFTACEAVWALSVEKNLLLSVYFQTGQFLEAEKLWLTVPCIFCSVTKYGVHLSFFSIWNWWKKKQANDHTANIMTDSFVCSNFQPLV